MSKKLKAYLEKLGIENVDEVVKKINADDDSEDVIEELLSGSQKYSKPFLQAEFKAQFDTERKTLKGKYFKDAAQKANKEFGSPLTNKEIDDIIADPENEGNTYDAVIKAVKAKVTEKTGKTDTELQKMLDLANGKISELEKSVTDKDEAHKKELTDTIGKIKLDSVLSKELTRILPKFTNMNPVKAAELIIDKIGKKAFLKLADNDSISLHDVADNAIPLKKNATELHTLESFVEGLAKEYELPVATSSKGSERKAGEDKKDKDINAPVLSGTATGLVAALERASA